MSLLRCLAGALLPGLLLLAEPALAQKEVPPPVKFGQPDPADFEAGNFAADSAAPAVVLCDYGTRRYDNVAGLRLILFERVVRIKILKKAGYGYASVEVPLYHQDGSRERLTNLRGVTYVRQPDGRISQTRMVNSSTFSEKASAQVDVQRFALPAVQEGAVVEYAYTIATSFTGRLPNWNFQWTNLPVRWSEYRVSYPNNYHYRAVYHGYMPLDVNEANTAAMLPMTVGNEATKVAGQAYRWAVRNVPALRPEPYVASLADYRAHISCELLGVQWPNEPYRDLRGNWKQKCERLREATDFGRALARADFLQPLVQPLPAQYPDPAARASAVRALVLQQVKYNGEAQWWTSEPLRRAWDLHHGNAAQLNLLLVAALRQAGLSAQPVLLSTPAHGRINPDFAQLDQFNYVLALVELPGGQDLLLDATEPLLPAGTLPPYCLAEVGHTVPDEGEGRWVPLPATSGLTHFQEVKMTLDAQGNSSSQVREELAGYSALAIRTQLARLGEKKLLAELTQKHPEWEILEYRFVAAADVSQPLTLLYTLRQAATAGSAEVLYVKPLAAFGTETNPFTLAERRFPVDFGMLQQDIVTLTLTLPAGYVAELPAPATLSLPEHGGRYLYAASSPAPGTVQIISRLSLDKPRYEPGEYQALRELYRQMLTKQAEALVIRKRP